MNIYDNIHGFIIIDNIAASIIDTYMFQRLRNIKQTGLLYFVWPSANHTRFEHSIGTYYLSQLMITNIKNKQPELNITKEIIDLISIAGLCHDLGHLSFSHLFDDYFINKIKLKSEINKTHEERSIFILKHIISYIYINNNELLLNDEQIKVISDLINPKKAEYNKWNDKYKIGEWIFQIISNPVNSIDVDKFDYIIRDINAVGLQLKLNYLLILNDARVINNNICYSSKSHGEIYNMFFIRYRLHRQIYNHKTVKAIEILLIKLIFELEEKLKISEYLTDIDKMLELDDMFIISKSNMKDIYNRKNKLPKLIYENISLINYEDIDEKILIEYFGVDTFEIIRFKAGYISGTSNNPLNNIQFYDHKTNKLLHNTLNKGIEKFSLLIKEECNEYFTRVYCTDLNILDEFKKYFSDIYAIDKE